MKRIDFNEYKKEELVSLLETLSEKEEVYNQIKQLLNKDALLEEYKQKMDEMFFPMYGMPISNLSISDALLEEYLKKSNDQSCRFEMIYLEMLLEFIKTYGMMSPSFYDRMIDLFTKIIGNSGTEFKERLTFVSENMAYISPIYHEKMSELLKNLDLLK